MYINHLDEIVYIAHPRTASSATSHVLLKNGFEIVTGHHHVDPELIPPEYRVMMTVRNPFDVLVSWYYNQKREQKSFTEWLPVFLNASVPLLDDGLFFGQKYATHVMRYETLQDDFDDVCHSLGLSKMTIPFRNVSKQREGHQFMGHYNFRTAMMVTERFHQDFLNNEYRTPLSYN